MLRQLKRTRSSPPSSPTAVNSIHSPVAGLKKGRKPVIVPSLYPDGWLAYLSRFLPDPDLASGLGWSDACGCSGIREQLSGVHRDRRYASMVFTAMGAAAPTRRPPALMMTAMAIWGLLAGAKQVKTASSRPELLEPFCAVPVVPAITMLVAGGPAAG